MEKAWALLASAAQVCPSLALPHRDWSGREKVSCASIFETVGEGLGVGDGSFAVGEGRVPVCGTICVVVVTGVCPPLLLVCATGVGRLSAVSSCFELKAASRSSSRI